MIPEIIRPLTLPEKLALITEMYNGKFLCFDDEKDDIVGTAMFLTDLSREKIERAFEDAIKFGFIKDDRTC